MSNIDGKQRFLFITGIVSPFWVELADQINKDPDMDFRIAFSLHTLGERGKHWKAFSSTGSTHFLIEEGQSLSSWLHQVFDSFKPQVAILGGIFSPWSQKAADLCSQRGVPFGYFGEQPNISPAPLQWVKLLRYRRELHRRKPRFFLAAGDRAMDLYGSLAPTSCQVTFFPYYQDHSSSLATQKRRELPQVTFLFSGRLIPRNSIREMTLAFEELARTREGRFAWCISAHGQEESFINEAMQRSKALREAVTFDRDFEQWSDRLRPFMSADVLVVPARHSGWGLVIPEAMACGLAVLATREVEAARYFVEEMVNGLFVTPTSSSILEGLKFCVDHPEIVEEMGNRGRTAATDGDVRTGAARFKKLMSRWFCTDRTEPEHAENDHEYQYDTTSPR